MNKVERGKIAAMELENSIWAEAFDEVRQDLINEMIGAKDCEAALNFRDEINGLDRVKARLQTWVSSAYVAEHGSMKSMERQK